MGSRDPVASPAEDLEIIPNPLVNSLGDWTDVVEDTGMRVIRSLNGSGFMDLSLTMFFLFGYFRNGGVKGRLLTTLPPLFLMGINYFQDILYSQPA